MTTTPDPFKPNMAETTGPHVKGVEADASVERRSR